MSSARTAPRRDVINDFFDGGTTQLAYRFLGGDFDGDPSTTPFLSTFFNINNPLGADTENPALSGATGVSLLRAAGGGAGRSHPSPAVRSDQPLLPGWDPCGHPGFCCRPFLAGTPQAQLLVNDFFSGGTPQVAYDLLGGDRGTPVDPNDPDSDLADTSTPYLSAFFGINNNILNPDGSDSPGLFGASRGSSSRGCTMAV